VAIRGRGNRLAKRLDRIAGIPLVWALGRLRRRRPVVPPRAIRRIGLLKTSAIGDTILLSGPASDLRRQFPDTEIVLFVGSSNREAAGLIQAVDRVVELAVERPLRAIRGIRRHPVDLLFDFAPWARINAVLACFARDGGLASAPRDSTATTSTTSWWITRAAALAFLAPGGPRSCG